MRTKELGRFAINSTYGMRCHVIQCEYQWNIFLLTLSYLCQHSAIRRKGCLFTEIKHNAGAGT